MSPGLFAYLCLSHQLNDIVAGLLHLDRCLFHHGGFVSWVLQQEKVRIGSLILALLSDFGTAVLNCSLHATVTGDLVELFFVQGIGNYLVDDMTCKDSIARCCCLFELLVADKSVSIWQDST